MTSLGEAIAKLRHERNMTQEALAEILCVSPQTISKWENSVNLPDVQMLPLIADVFGVRVDALFGREDALASTDPDKAFDRAVEVVTRVLAGAARPAQESSESWWERYRQSLLENANIRGGIYREHGVVYVRDAVGALALKRPEKGWHTLLSSESAVKTIHLLSSADFRRALGCVLDHRMRDFTLPFLCKRAGVEDAAALEACIRDSGLFEAKELVVDDRAMTFYSLTPREGRMLPLMAALTYCAEFADWREIFSGYFGGDVFD